MISQYKLRRLAPRAIRVANEHSDQPGLAIMKDVIVSSAENFISAYDKVRALEDDTSQEYKEGRDAMNRFNSIMVQLISAIRMQLPDFPVDFEFKGVPDDIFESVSVIIDKIIDLEEKPEVVTNDILPQLQTALEETEKEWREAEKSRNDLQDSKRILRENSTEFSHNLMLFRRAVGYALGRTDYEYKSLRESGANSPDSNDPETPEESNPTA